MRVLIKEDGKFSEKMGNISMQMVFGNIKLFYNYLMEKGLQESALLLVIKSFKHKKAT